MQEHNLLEIQENMLKDQYVREVTEDIERKCGRRRRPSPTQQELNQALMRIHEVVLTIPAELEINEDRDKYKTSGDNMRTLQKAVKNIKSITNLYFS